MLCEASRPAAVIGFTPRQHSILGPVAKGINRRRNEQQGTFVSTGQFLLGYLTAWIGFSLLATLAQWGLLTAALLSPMMKSTSKMLGGGLLLCAGLFWRDELVVGRQYQRLCPSGEDHPSEPIIQPSWRSFIHWLGSLGFFWLVGSLTEYLFVL